MEQTIYLINGFLESGKTTFIKEFLDQEYFYTDRANLLIVCEEGDEVYGKSFCQAHNVIIKTLESEKEFTVSNIKKMAMEIHPERIIVEFNGMWDIDHILEQWDFWQIFEITILDAQVFEIYSRNLKSLMINQIRNADMTVFRSCDGKENKLADYRRSIRAVNPRTNFVFKTENGEIMPRLDEDLPYDMNHNLIVLPDADFGIFYIDVTEYVKRYVGKRVCFRGYIYKKKQNMLLIGWPAMTCCMQDITVFAFICDTAEAENFKTQQWVRTEGMIKEEYFEKVNTSIPVIDVLWIEECPEPEEKIINKF